jgi:hypothetical protein
MTRRRRAQIVLLPQTPLLISESADEFDRIRDALDQEIEPRGIIEQMYVSDIACLIWEILRLRRCKAALINSQIHAALITVLTQILREPGQGGFEVEAEAKKLAYAWNNNKVARRRVLKLLAQKQLDESAIEAEAIQKLSTEIEQLDRMLTSSESRRNKALRAISEYRGGLARQLGHSTDQLIDGNVLALDHGPSKKPSTAA